VASDPALEDIRQRVDIVELVREYLPGLKRAGRSFKACCPFHQEKTPSFTVSSERQTFHCFGCQTGGDLFTFVMKMEGLEFPEAVEKLAARAGVTLPKHRQEASPAQLERKRLVEALERAREFYHGLLASKDAQLARQYLEKRGLQSATIESFKLGFAPADGRALLAAAGSKGFDQETLLKAGLASRRDGGAFRDFFRGRILYPIQNAKGETVGFGARVLGAGEPKYLNTADTPLFSKGRMLYGFFEGLPALRKERKAVLMEGYMDVLAAHQAGFTHACAPLGTAVTEEHAALLARYVEEVTFLFDPDAAGASAAVRGAELLLEKGLKVRVATVPGGLDPDELIQEKGAKALARCLEEGVDLAEFRTILELKGRSGAFLEPDEKVRVAAQVLETIRRCPDEVRKSEWVSRLAQRLDTDEESLRLQLRKPAEGRSRFAAKTAPAAAHRALPADDQEMLVCLLKQPALAASDEFVAESDFLDERSRAVFSALRRGLEAGDAAPAKILAELSENERAVATALLCGELRHRDPAAGLEKVVSRVRKERRLKEIEPAHLRMIEEGRGQSAEAAALKEELDRLWTELKGTRKE
jgi:DNA primase